MNNIIYNFYQNKSSNPSWYLTSCDLSKVSKTDGSLQLPSRIGTKNDDDTYSFYQYSIYNCCFYGEDKITSIGIPATIISIGANVFSRSSITSIYFYGTKAPSVAMNAFNNMPKDFKIYVPKGFKDRAYHTVDFIQALGGQAQWEEKVLEGDFSVSLDNQLEPLTLYGQQGVSTYYINELASDIGIMALWETQDTSSQSTVVVGQGDIIQAKEKYEILSYKDGVHLYRTDPKQKSDFKNILNTTTLLDSIQPNAVYGDNFNEEIVLNAKEVMSLSFQNCEKIKTISITKNVQYISPYAFINCPSLTKIELPEKHPVFEIIKGTYLIDKTRHMLCAVYNKNQGDFSTSTLNSVFTRITSIPAYSFYNATKLTALINIPLNIEHIGLYAFANSSLRGLNVLARNTQLIIDDYAFENCSSLTNIFFAGGSVQANAYSFGGTLAPDIKRRVTIGETKNQQLNIIKDNTFKDRDSGVHNIDTLTILDNEEVYNKYLNDPLWSRYITKGYDDIKNFVFDNGIDVIDSSFGLSNNPYLQTVTIPPSVSKITDSAFQNCTSLYQVTFREPDENETVASQLSITNKAFYGCSALYTFTIPERTLTISSEAFKNCYKMVEILNLSPKITIEPGKNTNGYIGYYLPSNSCVITNPSNTHLFTDDKGRVFYKGSKNCHNLQRIDKEVYPTALGPEGYFDIVWVQQRVTHQDGTVTEGHMRIRSMEINPKNSKLEEFWYVQKQDNYPYAQKEQQCEAVLWEEKISKLINYWNNNNENFTSICMRDTNVILDPLTKGYKYHTNMQAYQWNNTTNFQFLVHIPVDKDDNKKITLPNICTIKQAGWTEEYVVYDYLLYSRLDIEQLIIPNEAKIKYICPYAFANMRNLSYIYYGTNAELVSQEERHDNDEYIWKNGIFMNAGRNTAGLSLTFGTGVTAVQSNLFHPDGRRDMSQNYPKIINIDFVGKNNLQNSLETIEKNYVDSCVTKIGTMAFLGIPSLIQLYLNQKIQTNFGTYAFKGDDFLFEIWGASQELQDYKGQTGPNDSYVVAKTLKFYNSYSESSVLMKIDTDFIFDTSNSASWSLIRYEGKSPTIILPAAQAIQGHSYSLNAKAFYSLPFVQTVVLNNMITGIGDYCFYNNQQLLQINNLTPNIKTIGPGAFEGCAALTTINLEDTTITALQRNTFFNCKSLTQLYLPKTITKLDHGCLQNCNSLHELTVPSTVKNINDYAFWFGGKTDSTKITFIMQSAVPPTITSNAFDKARIKEIIIPKGSLEAYKNEKPNWCNLAEYLIEA